MKMEWLTELFFTVEFWMGLSLVAAALPGPQTRVLPTLLKAVAAAIAETKQNRG